MRISKILKPVNEETLTTYLLRTAEANYYEMREFFALLGANPRVHFNHRIDIKPKDNLDIIRVVGYTGQSYDALMSMTFYPLENKFVRSSIRTSFELLRELYDVNRRFCPSCLMEFNENKQCGIYKRIWQITDISICDKHYTPLVSQCKFCGTKQPYIADSLVEYLCSNCGKELYYESEPSALISSEQFNRISQWQTLISSEIAGLTDRPEIVYEVLIAITLLFLLQKSPKTEINDIPQEIIPKQELYRAFEFIKFGSDYLLTPFMLLKYLNLIGLSVENFFNTKVPDWFIDKLLDYLKIDYGQLCYSERNTNCLPNRSAEIRVDISPQKRQ
jgi:hypothetical protein